MKFTNSREVRNALEPMANFAPAVLYTADIMQAAEKAEADLAENKKQKAKLDEEIAEVDAKLAARRQELHKLGREAEAMKEALKPNSKRIHDIESREMAIGAREASVVAREEAVLVREQKAKDLADRLASFHDLHS